jgi:hypothetical protein
VCRNGTPSRNIGNLQSSPITLCLFKVQLICVAEIMGFTIPSLVPWVVSPNRRGEIERLDFGSKTGMQALSSQYHCTRALLITACVVEICHFSILTAKSQARNVVNLKCFVWAATGACKYGRIASEHDWERRHGNHKL